MVGKSFTNDFYTLLDLLKKRVPFAFNRFSDGELFILQNKELILGENLIKIGDKKTVGPYVKEDHKHFDPNKHGFSRDRLMDAFMFQKDFYFKGIGCTCCIGQKNFDWQFEKLHEKSSAPYLTWANLLVNGNYPRFIDEMYPVLTTYDAVILCNENARTESMPFIKKKFTVGYNAMVNDYGIIEEMKEWIRENKISGQLFLFAASSLSKMAIHQLFKEFPENTYIDIGTTLNGFMNMSIERQYLGDYWYMKPGPADTFKICRWSS